MEQKAKERIDPELKEIVIQRLLSTKLPENIKLSVGSLSEKPMSMNELVEHVREEDEIGMTVMDMQLNYLRALKEGIIKKIIQNE